MEKRKEAKKIIHPRVEKSLLFLRGTSGAPKFSCDGEMTLRQASSTWEFYICSNICRVTGKYVETSDFNEDHAPKPRLHLPILLAAGHKKLIFPERESIKSLLR
jgi:hypothetical protein